MNTITTNAEVAAILDCLPHPAILLSTDYHILLANQRYQQIYGDGELLRRRRCFEISHRYSVPCDLAGESCPLKASLQTGQPQQVLHIHHTPRGQEYVDVETLPVKDAQGHIKYLIEVIKPSDIAQPQASQEGLVGRSQSFNKMLDLVRRVAPSDTTVMLSGESGTGKEMIAKTIHQRSKRVAGPFVPVECTGLPETLFESELFGYEKGAFTGAQHSKQGLVEAAEGGTLFLDEIGDIPLSAQVKLLRLLETHTYRRIGNPDVHKADFRLICATNKNLATLVENGAFREDLYYRLNVFDIELPALRERQDDIPLLVESMIKRLAPDRKITVSSSALACLQAYRFPGNIRELRNIVERALLLADGHELLPVHLPTQCQRLEHNKVRHEAAADNEIISLEQVEQRYLQRIMTHYPGERRELAQKLGISERALYRKLAAIKKTESADSV